jgi:hypothetical protein
MPHFAFDLLLTIERPAKITKYLRHVTLSSAGLSREWDGMNTWAWLAEVSHLSSLNIVKYPLNPQANAVYPDLTPLYRPLLVKCFSTTGRRAEFKRQVAPFQGNQS